MDRRQSLLSAQGQVFRIPAVDYDGNSEYLEAAAGSTPRISGGSSGILSTWFRIDGDDGANITLAAGANGLGDSLIIQRNVSNKFLFVWAGGLGTFNQFQSNSLFTTDSDWKHLMASWNNTGDQHLYIDGVDELDSIEAAGSSDFMVDSLFAITSSSEWNGAISQFYFTDEYLDLSVSGNRDKLYNSSDATFVNLGEDASSVTGTQPLIYLTGNYTNAGENSGSESDFTVQGTPSNTYAPKP